MEEDIKVLNYRGLEHFLERLKLYFIIKPKNGEEGLVLTLYPEGAILWSSLPKMLIYKGSVATYSALENIENPQLGWVYYVVENEAEYYWNGERWEYFGQELEVPEYTEGQNISISDYEVSALGYKWDPDSKSFAEGKFSNSSSTPANGSYSHTEGRDTKTDGLAAHAEGYFTLAEGKASHSEGFGVLFNTGATGFDWFETTDHNADLKVTIETSSGASSKTILTLIKEIYFISEISDLHIYLYSRDEKESCAVYKYYLEINGSEFDPEDPYTDTTVTSGAIYFKVNDTSLIGGTLDFLVYNYAEGQVSHVEGKNTEAHGKNSHAEGLVNKTNGENSHVEGHLNYISSDGYNAHAEGYNTRALKNQAHSEGANTLAYGENSHVEGEETCAWGKDSHAEGKSSTSPALYNEIYFKKNKEVIYSDWNSKDSDEDSYSCSWGSVSHTEGKNTLALGNNSHAEGQGTCAYGDKSHAEGSNTLAQGNNSHAEGDASEATGFASHSEGGETEAFGRYSHAEGRSYFKSASKEFMTVAAGDYSHAEGFVTHTQNESEHAEGHCNISHKTSNTYGNAGNTLHSIGIGTISVDYQGAHISPKNALEIMQNGEMYVLNVGGYDGVHIKSETGYENTKTLQDVLRTIPSTNTLTGVTFNGTSATVSGGVASITASVGDTNVIETVKINGTALTPDSNKAVDITVFSGSGNSHTSGLVPDPGATAGASKYLCEDGTWSTPADSDTTYTFTEGSTDGAFSVTPSGGSASSVTVHNVLKTTGGTMTGQVYYNESGTVTSTVSCTRKYNWLEINSDTSLSITMPLSLAGPCEVIYAIKNTHSTNSVTLTLPSTGHNMIGLSVFTIEAGKIAELVFTFWSTTDVSFNGGVEQ